MSALQFARAALLSLMAVSGLAFSFSLDDLSDRDAGLGLRAALNKGAETAVNQLGKENGFLSNEQVKIHLPSILEKARPLLQLAGGTVSAERALELGALDLRDTLFPQQFAFLGALIVR